MALAFFATRDTTVVAVGRAPEHSPVRQGDTRTSSEYNLLEADIVRNLDHMEELLTSVQRHQSPAPMHRVVQAETERGALTSQKLA